MDIIYHNWPCENLQKAETAWWVVSCSKSRPLAVVNETGAKRLFKSDTNTKDTTDTNSSTTNTVLSPTEHTVVDGSPQNSQSLSSADVAYCISEKSTLNLTAENEISVFYHQPFVGQTSHSSGERTTANVTVTPLTPRHDLGASQPQQKADVERKRGSRLLHRDTSLGSVAGSCSVSIQAPAGKALSVLFGNQTCSRQNHAHVRDPHDGWSTRLDGCSLWKSPGYDVTTAGRSAVVVIEVLNPTEFFRLKVQVKAVVLQTTDGVFTRYVSPVLGYIQTPGWHPFARPFAGTTKGTAVVVVPLNHVTLLSVVFKWVCSKKVQLVTVTVSGESETPWREQYLSCEDRPKEVLLTNLTEFRVKCLDVPGHFFHGIRVLFTFHGPQLTPRRYSKDLWNCSVSFWRAFRQHFLCNQKAECAGREDEMGCPVTSCHQGRNHNVGMLLNDSCYIFLRMPIDKIHWHDGNTACKQRGLVLASFKTVNSWYHLALLSLPKDVYRAYIGLQSPDASYPHRYRYLLQWHNGSLSHYTLFRVEAPPPSCATVLRDRGVLILSCTSDALFPTYAICQMISPSAKSVSPGRSYKVTRRHGLTKELQSASGDIYGQGFPLPGLSCPDRHWTHNFLAFDALSTCCKESGTSLSSGNVTTDDAAPPTCADVDVTSFKALFPCQTGKSYVPYSLVCNHLHDCADNSDEDFCVFPPCLAASQYKCGNGQCLHFHQHCDEFVQCVDESDEADCTSLDLDFRKEYTLPRPPAVGNFDGRGWMEYTALTAERETGAVVCPDTHVFCPGEGFCLPVYVWCNGLFDCPGREDESDCDTYRCPGLYRCRGVLDICLHPGHLCDGWPQCPQHDDEQFCNLTCPVNCTCLGHAFACRSEFHVRPFSRLRYLDASGTGLEPASLVTNSMLVYLSLAGCKLSDVGNMTLPNLLSLDLTNNRLSVFTVAELNLTKNLQNLSLARNPLTKLFSYANYSSSLHEHTRILHIDLSGVELKVLDMPGDLPFPRLLSLNLSNTGVTHVIRDGFSSLTSLRILDLRGCPMTEFPRLIFKNLFHLRLVFAHNYKLCCRVSLPVNFNTDNCRAPINEISSCDALLRADVYRVCLSVLAALALSGNLVCFSLRICSFAGRSKTGFSVFVTHLCVSDFVMGVYMAMIGVADRLYLGNYLWEDVRWRNSAACQAAGILALFSSEVSAFIICLITLDRFLVIRFPFSQLRFSSFSAQVAMLMTWTVGVILVTVPILPATAYEHFYGQTGICVPLPITRSDFAGHGYAFGVMILLNLVVFLTIAAGQIFVYQSMTSNAMSAIDTARKSRDLIVARRLITVVLSDFLCWFPLGLLGVLAAQGVPVPGEVNVAMAIFVLPLNSALNPFLYTLNMIREKQRRATEKKLLKMILDRGIDDPQNTNKE